MIRFPSCLYKLIVALSEGPLRIDRPTTRSALNDFHRLDPTRQGYREDNSCTSITSFRFPEQHRHASSGGPLMKRLREVAIGVEGQYDRCCGRADPGHVGQRLYEGTFHHSLFESFARAIGEDQSTVGPPLRGSPRIILPLALPRQGRLGEL